MKLTKKEIKKVVSTFAMSSRCQNGLYASFVCMSTTYLVSSLVSSRKEGVPHWVADGNIELQKHIISAFGKKVCNLQRK